LDNETQKVRAWNFMPSIETATAELVLVTSETGEYYCNKITFPYRNIRHLLRNRDPLYNWAKIDSLNEYSFFFCKKIDNPEEHLIQWNCFRNLIQSI
jgi:hypothetical protein